MDQHVWAPLPLADVCDLLASFTGRWWISGGLALELFVGRSWRDHDDTDVGILRDDAPRVRAVLGDWDIHVASQGTLRPWNGEPLRRDHAENNLWCRRHVETPWALDLTLNDGDDDAWISRRDATWRVPWSEAILLAAPGTPYLSPDVQLTFKSKNPRPKDDLDARTVIPELTTSMKDVLRHRLPSGHPWRTLL